MWTVLKFFNDVYTKLLDDKKITGILLWHLDDQWPNFSICNWYSVHAFIIHCFLQVNLAVSRLSRWSWSEILRRWSCSASVRRIVKHMRQVWPNWTSTQVSNHRVTGAKTHKVWLTFNSLWLSDVIWQQGSRSTLAQVMACCLTAPSHYLNQCWLVITKVQWLPSITKFSMYKTLLKSPKG